MVFCGAKRHFFLKHLGCLLIAFWRAANLVHRTKPGAISTMPSAPFLLLGNLSVYLLNSYLLDPQAWSICLCNLHGYESKGP